MLVDREVEGLSTNACRWHWCCPHMKKRPRHVPLAASEMLAHLHRQRQGSSVLSAFGPKRTCASALQMSAFGCKADGLVQCKCPLLMLWTAPGPRHRSGIG